MVARGFTMLEMMIVMAILALLAAIAAPSFNDMVVNQRVKDAASELHMTMLLARSESLKRGVSIQVVPNDDDWLKGWKMTDPANANVVLDQRSALPTTIAVDVCNMSASGGISFTNVGRLDTSAHPRNPTFQVSTPLTSIVRCVSTELSGRASVSLAACSAC